MLISEKLLYLELPKTACSHIRDLLKFLIGGELVGKHNRPPNKLIQQNKHIIGSIRSPWDWYLSLWSFGCDAKGVLYKRLTSRQLRGYGLTNNLKIISWSSVTSFLLENIFKPIKTWQRLYSDSHNPELFREWLYYILDLNSMKKYSFGDAYAFSSISSFAGIYTYYYIRLFSKNLMNVYSQDLNDLYKLKQFDIINNILDDIIKIENLEEDLIQILEKIGYELSKSDLETIYSFKPTWHLDENTNTNSSSRIRNIQYYYDKETIDLVAKTEKFIIDKYDYKVPIIY